MIVLPDAENRTIVSSFVWTKHGNVMGGQTDGQTDRQNHSGYYTDLHCEQCGHTVMNKHNHSLLNA